MSTSSLDDWLDHIIINQIPCFSDMKKEKTGYKLDKCSQNLKLYVYVDVFKGFSFKMNISCKNLSWRSDQQ